MPQVPKLLGETSAYQVEGESDFISVTARPKHPGQHELKAIPGSCSKDLTYLLDTLSGCYILSGSEPGRVYLQGVTTFNSNLSV